MKENDFSCPNCGEYMIGDGYSNGDPVRCPNALEENWWYSEPDNRGMGERPRRVIMLEIIFKHWKTGEEITVFGK